MSKDKSFEKSLEELEKIVETLGDDDITLEDSIKQYKNGMALVDYCNKAIDKIEKELEILSKDEL